MMPGFDEVSEEFKDKRHRFIKKEPVSPASDNTPQSHGIDGTFNPPLPKAPHHPFAQPRSANIEAQEVADWAPRVLPLMLPYDQWCDRYMAQKVAQCGNADSNGPERESKTAYVLMCIGGPSAGRRISVPCDRYIVETIDPSPMVVHYNPDAPPPSAFTIRTTLYRRTNWKAGTLALQFLIPTDMREEEALIELQRGYLGNRHD